MLSLHFYGLSVCLLVHHKVVTYCKLDHHKVVKCHHLGCNKTLTFLCKDCVSHSCCQFSFICVLRGIDEFKKPFLLLSHFLAFILAFLNFATVWLDFYLLLSTGHWLKNQLSIANFFFSFIIGSQLVTYRKSIEPAEFREQYSSDPAHCSFHCKLGTIFYKLHSIF